ncbi:MAG: cation:proton antiporter [Candidatus Izimaplasma sp.]|nr:cation:proton antiporter [Candidatus Izimaplasma bacterium]
MFFLLNANYFVTYETLLVLAFVILLGLYGGRIFEKIKLPHITGYISVGVLFGGLLVFLHLGELISNLEVISSVALGFIAFSIGAELDFNKLKKSGTEVFVITIIQAFLAATFTTVGVLLFGQPLPIALVLGAIATATAPAPIMLLTKKYRSRGYLTDMLLPLVGMDDGVGIILFGMMLSIANSLYNGANLSFIKMLERPAFELLFSTLIAISLGLIASFLANKVSTKDSQKQEVFLVISIFTVFVTVALAKMHIQFGEFVVHLSPILTPMILGMVLSNKLPNVRAHDLSLSVEEFTSPILIAFFTIAGAELVVAFSENTDVAYISLLGVTATYIIFRIVGKLSGAYLGSMLMNSHRNVKKYLGICLLPQAGVALGMAYQAKSDFGEAGVTVLIVVLIATLFYELFGPIGIKYSLEHAGEIRQK